MKKIIVICGILFFSFNLTAQVKKQTKKNVNAFKSQPQFNINIFKKKRPIYLIGAIGTSYGPEHILGLPLVNISAQSHYRKGMYLGVQFGSLLGFTASHGFHTGIGYKWLTMDYSLTKMNTSSREYVSHNLKAGINISCIWIKFGPSIPVGHDYYAHFKDKYPFNIELLISSRMVNVN